MSEPRRHIRRGPTRLTVKNSGRLNNTYIKTKFEFPEIHEFNHVQKTSKGRVRDRNIH